MVVSVIVVLVAEVLQDSMVTMNPVPSLDLMERVQPMQNQGPSKVSLSDVLSVFDSCISSVWSLRLPGDRRFLLMPYDVARSLAQTVSSLFVTNMAFGSIKVTFALNTETVLIAIISILAFITLYSDVFRFTLTLTNIGVARL